MPTDKESTQTRRGGENQVLGAGGKPLLVIVEGHDINAMVEAGLEAIGGLGRVIGNHTQVLLKPNTNQQDPFPSITAPETLRAVADHCRIAGVEHIVVHEDHKWDFDPYYSSEELPGMDVQISHSSEAGHYVLVEYEKWHGDLDPDVDLKDVELTSPAANLNSGFQKTEGPCLRVARQLQEAPVVINMPVLKRHFAGQMTSALKNHFGSVYGAHRWMAHGSLENNRDYYDRKLAEFASAVRPELTITDIRSLQAVSGPFIGEDTRIVEGVNRLIITGDMIAADVVAMDVMKKYDDTFTPTNEAIVRRQQEHAEALGVGTGDLSKFEIVELTA
ncbi:DUF362 domain-containing protein [bacterium]|nr:DUF362 domain-containing protein [bacterium]